MLGIIDAAICANSLDMTNRIYRSFVTCRREHYAGTPAPTLCLRDSSINDFLDLLVAEEYELPLVVQYPTIVNYTSLDARAWFIFTCIAIMERDHDLLATIDWWAYGDKALIYAFRWRDIRELSGERW